MRRSDEMHAVVLATPQQQQQQHQQLSLCSPSTADRMTAELHCTDANNQHSKATTTAGASYLCSVGNQCKRQSLRRLPRCIVSDGHLLRRVATTTLLSYLSYLYSAALAPRIRRPFFSISHSFFSCGLLWRLSKGRLSVQFAGLLLSVRVSFQ